MLGIQIVEQAEQLQAREPLPRGGLKKGRHPPRPDGATNARNRFLVQCGCHSLHIAFLLRLILGGNRADEYQGRPGTLRWAVGNQSSSAASLPRKIDAYTKLT